MKKLLLAVVAFAALAVSCSSPAPVKNEMRAPSYPLITIDPYTSAWSPADNLYDHQVTHWTGKKFPFLGTLRVDGQLYRFMGEEEMVMTALAPVASQDVWTASYTMEKPNRKWTEADFNEKNWKQAPAPFGTKQYYDVNTEWDSSDIWVRRTVEFKPEEVKDHNLFILYSHDDIFKLYVNGEELIATDYSWKENVYKRIPAELIAKANGKLTIAAHCHNRAGGALVDFGVYKQPSNAVVMNQTAVQTSADVQATRTI